MKNKFIKLLAFQALSAVLLANMSLAHAKVAMTVAGKKSVTFTISNLANATGYGGHFSTGAAENGYGGVNVECHFVSGSKASPQPTMALYCFDAIKSPLEYNNTFVLQLGSKKGTNLSGSVDTLSHATFTVSSSGVQVNVTRIAINSYTNEKKPYVISSFFPLRKDTGFFKTGVIYFARTGLNTNGVLSDDPARTGSGYVLNAAPVVR